MPSVQQRYDSLQVARILGALLVVTYHFGAVELHNGGERLISPLLSYADMVIDLFFVVSGFLMGTLYSKARGGVREVAEFGLRRALRIYPSYWLITMVVLALWAVSGGQLFSKLAGSNPDILSSLLLIPSAKPPVLNVAWTLVHEVYFYAGFAVLLVLKPAQRPLGAALWAAAVALGYVALREPNNHPALALMVSPYTLEFIAGVGLGWIIPHLRGHAPRLALFLGAGLWVLVLLHTHLSPAEKRAMPELGRIAVDGITALLICYGLAAADLTRLWTCPAFLTKSGEWSYAIYLVHTVVIAGLCCVWRRFSVPGILDNAVVWALAMTVSVFLAAQIFIYLERPANKSAKKIIQFFSRNTPIVGAVSPSTQVLH